MYQQKLTAYYQLLPHYDFTLYLTRCMWVNRGKGPLGGCTKSEGKLAPVYHGASPHQPHVRKTPFVCHFKKLKISTSVFLNPRIYKKVHKNACLELHNARNYKKTLSSFRNKKNIFFIFHSYGG